MSLQITEARTMARELASKGCGAQTILSELFANFDGMRFYEAKGKIWAEGDDVYFPPQVLCILSTCARVRNG